MEVDRLLPQAVTALLEFSRSEDINVLTKVQPAALTMSVLSHLLCSQAMKAVAVLFRKTLVLVCRFHLKT